LGQVLQRFTQGRLGDGTKMRSFPNAFNAFPKGMEQLKIIRSVLLLGVGQPLRLISLPSTSD